ncbi:hypothetical protein [Veillonella sp. 20925_1_51]
MDFFTKPFVKTIRFPTKKKYNIIKKTTENVSIIFLLVLEEIFT